MREITLDHLSCGYGQRVVLEDLNLKLGAGRITCVLGHSGCGKSTLLRTLLLLERPLGGRMLFGDLDPVAMDQAALMRLRREVGVLFQGAALFGELSLLENAAFPLLQDAWPSRARALEIARRNLDLLGLAPFADHLPNEVSGGMRKRAGIARALALDPPWLFLDEPGAGLDPVTAADLDAMILRIRDTLRTTIVIITHELLSIERIADDLVMLGEGRCIAHGTAAAVRAAAHPLVQSFFEARHGGKAIASAEPRGRGGLADRLVGPPRGTDPESR